MAQLARQSREPMRVEEIMTRNPVSADVSSSIQDVADLLFAADVRHIPIINKENDELVAMVSDRDLRTYVLLREEHLLDPNYSKSRLRASIGSICETDVLSVEEGEEVSEVIDLMIENKIGAVPVVEPGSKRLVGIVSYVDILRAVRDLV